MRYISLAEHNNNNDESISAFASRLLVAAFGKGYISVLRYPPEDKHSFLSYETFMGSFKELIYTKSSSLYRGIIILVYHDHLFKLCPWRILFYRIYFSQLLLPTSKPCYTMLIKHVIGCSFLPPKEAVQVSTKLAEF